MKIKYDKNLDFELSGGKVVQINCGSLEGVSKRLQKLLKDAKGILNAPIYFSDSSNCPEVPNNAYVMTHRPNGYWVFIDSNRATESDIAHEIIEATLEAEGELHITSTNMTQDFKSVFNLLESLIRDYEVDRRLMERGFDDIEASKRDLKNLCSSFDTEGDITPGRDKFYAMKKSIVVTGCLVKDQSINMGMPERELVIQKLKVKSPGAFQLYEGMKNILESADLLSAQSRIDTAIQIWNEVFDPYLKIPY